MLMFLVGNVLYVAQMDIFCVNPHFTRLTSNCQKVAEIHGVNAVCVFFKEVVIRRKCEIMNSTD